MTGLPKRVARRWYLGGTISSIVALVFVVMAQAGHVRIAYPLGFVFTMAGILAMTRPGWEWPQRRPRIVKANAIVFAVQIATLAIGLHATGA